MSIYRKFDREPINDMHARPVKRVDAPQPAPAPSNRGGPPVETLPLTLEWESRLPSDVRPTALVRRFPRIANFIATNWLKPVSLFPYLDELFVDRRGNRRGFPPEVMAELFTLRAYYEELHPSLDRRWDQSQHHR